MLILGLRTDKTEAQIALFDDTKLQAEDSWQAHKQLAETLHSKINALLQANDHSWTDIEGIVFYKGPGSFTGLRIGAAVVNALASELPAIIVGANGEEWLQSGINRLLAGENDHMIVPDYGAPVHITPQKK